MKTVGLLLGIVIGASLGMVYATGAFNSHTSTTITTITTPSDCPFHKLGDAGAIMPGNYNSTDAYLPTKSDGPVLVTHYAIYSSGQTPFGLADTDTYQVLTNSTLHLHTSNSTFTPGATYTALVTTCRGVFHLDAMMYQ